MYFLKNILEGEGATGKEEGRGRGRKSAFASHSGLVFMGGSVESWSDCDVTNVTRRKNSPDPGGSGESDMIFQLYSTVAVDFMMRRFSFGITGYRSSREWLRRFLRLR